MTSEQGKPGEQPSSNEVTCFLDRDRVCPGDDDFSGRMCRAWVSDGCAIIGLANTLLLKEMGYRSPSTYFTFSGPPEVK